MTTAPSSSAPITSSGKTATPPQPMGSCQLTKVRLAMEAGAATPADHTGRPLLTTPLTSRSTPSVTRAARPRFCMRAHRISPKMPASVTPMASATTIAPSGIASMAARVDFGDAHDCGVAKSSRLGTKRSVKARPAMRRPAALARGFGPRIHTLRRPFLCRTVVMVAVEISAKAASGISAPVRSENGQGQGALRRRPLHQRLIPALDVGARLARKRQVEPAMRDRSERKVGDSERIASDVAVAGELLVEDRHLGLGLLARSVDGGGIALVGRRADQMPEGVAHGRCQLGALPIHPAV